MKAKLLASAAPVCAALLCGASGSANAAPAFPGVGNDTNGPTLLITLGTGSTATLGAGPSSQGAYDGVEDTYIGVVNNSGVTVNSIILSAPAATGIFGFDGDGIGVQPVGGYPGPGSGSIQYGTPNASDTAHPNNGCDTLATNSGFPCTGYGGPIGFFSNIMQSGANQSGILNFAGGLANGAFTWFALEEPLTSVSFSVST